LSVTDATLPPSALHDIFVRKVCAYYGDLPERGEAFNMLNQSGRSSRGVQRTLCVKRGETESDL
jgi:hypothetical protein